MQVSADESVLRVSPGSARRSRASRPTSSAARCCASAAEPPLPQNMSLPPALIIAAQRRAAELTGVPSDASRVNTVVCRASASSNVIRDLPCLP